MKIWIATGGTGGHIFPALAVAAAIVKNESASPTSSQTMGPGLRRGDDIITISTDGRGYDLVMKNKPAGAKVVRVWASGVGNRSAIGKIVALSKIALSAKALFFRFLISRPDRIIAFGGYSSVPAVLAGKILRIPVFLHEQNAAAGRANALSAKFADKILTSFPGTTGLPKNAKVVLTGLPVRSDFKPSDYNNSNQILITGGSLGAAILRDVAPEAISMLPAAIKKNLMVVQQVDEASVHRVGKFYAAAGIKHRLAPFFRDMASEITDAAIVIGRSGASTIAELMVVGRPAVLVPLGINPDQMANARAFEKLGGGIVIEQKDFSPKQLSRVLTELFENPARLQKMADAARAPNEAVRNILRNVL
ncbi:MAG: UDP-N-acetylglucosamine--N-acetylmuramyl-(pentapeptide) pyrophosphoryl-undecaprenol N-acetylglucosamine transferase [Rickettsiales bacterium]|jgi:UDP-N-acetylglucosamine--N-acetylmuramyl-(pentapeptide) pyrophosphoryl-undecaprenol N-acetylglucosamine transferase|nr:UDP-N-acetylglucosamine--N-acetylmuramyl-(pentapeptide) pyrophosphoryl-undecaprenol N-acetylglucosamine transferase [Rickettsiales bacterium]